MVLINGQTRQRGFWHPSQPLYPELTSGNLARTRRSFRLRPFLKPTTGMSEKTLPCSPSGVSRRWILLKTFLRQRRAGWYVMFKVSFGGGCSDLFCQSRSSLLKLRAFIICCLVFFSLKHLCFSHFSNSSQRRSKEASAHIRLNQRA